jgi:hydroxyacylglutathione hydrolase
MPRIIENISLVGRGRWHDMPAFSGGTSSTCYLIDGGSELALVDIGLPPAVSDVLRNMRELGYDPARVTKVLLSHAHSDHTGGLADFLKQVNATVYGHLKTKETMGKGPGIYDPAFLPLDHVPAPVHEVLKEGDTVRVGEVTLNVIELPGHTPDGLGYTFQLPAGLACFTGDTLVGDQPCLKGVTGWMDGHWGSKVSHLKNSLERLKRMELVAFFGGHGDAHIKPETVRSSIVNAIALVDGLLAVKDLGWLVAMDI